MAIPAMISALRLASTPVRYFSGKPLRWWTALVGAMIITVYYGSILGPILMHHAVWRDEAQAWLIARDSHSVGELLAHMKYEGHPPLWHLMLYVITRFTTDIAYMQLLNLVISIATVFVVARWSPLNWLEKFLFAGGYYVLFEYGAISRNYQLAALCLFAVCAVWSRRRTAFILQALCLGLLCFTTIYGLIIVFPLTSMILLDAAICLEVRRTVAQKPWQFGLAVLLVALCAFLSIRQITPPPDSSYAAADGWFFAYPHADAPPAEAVNNKALQQLLDENFKAVWDAYAPIPGDRKNFWNTSILPPSTDRQLIANWCVTILAAAALCLAWRPRALAVFLAGTTGLLAFMYVKFFGNPRHHGSLFLLFVASYWIAFSHVPARRAWWRQLISTLLVVAIAAFLLWGFPAAIARAVPAVSAALTGGTFKLELPPAISDYHPEILDIIAPYLRWIWIILVPLFIDLWWTSRQFRRQATPPPPPKGRAPERFGFTRVLRRYGLLLWEIWSLLCRRYVPHTGLFILLCVQVFAANIALKDLNLAPFSAGKQAAEYLRTQLQPGELVVTDQDSMTASVAAYMPGQQFYNTRGDRLVTFNIWDNAKVTQTVYAAARQLAAKYDHTMIVMTFGPGGATPGIRPLKAFGGGIQGDEKYYFYRVFPPGAIPPLPRGGPP